MNDTTADQRTHEAQLRHLSDAMRQFDSIETGDERADACLAGADALARVTALEAAIRIIPEWDDRGVCSFVGCSGHTAFSDYKPRAHDGNCPRRALDAVLGVTLDSPGGTR